MDPIGIHGKHSSPSSLLMWHQTSSPVSPNAMALELPSDDDGTGMLPIKHEHHDEPVLKTTRKRAPQIRAQQKSKPKAKAKASSHSAVLPVAEGLDSGFALPSDDEGGLDLDDPPARPKVSPGPSRGTCTIRSSGLASPEVQALGWESDTFKKAAATIESHVSMPFLDLQQMIQQARHATLPPHERDDLWEVYSCPRMTPKMRELGGKASRSYDLAHYFNFTEEKYQRLLIQDISLCRPKFVMFSPPCRYVCQLMHSNWGRMQPQKRFLNLVEACHHIDMTMWAAGMLNDYDDEFGFEHPHLSLAWERDSATRLQTITHILSCDRWQNDSSYLCVQSTVLVQHHT